MGTLFLQGKAYSFTELATATLPVHPALDFCRQWLNGTDAFEIRTSGSTGTPKTIRLQRSWMAWSAARTAEQLQATQKDHLLLCLSTTAIGGLMVLVRAMEWGCDITVTEPSPDPMALLPDKHPYTITSLVAMQLANALQHPFQKEKIQQFRHIVLGGSPVLPSLAAQLPALQPTVWHSYGMTETCSHIALKKLNGSQPDPHFVPFGELQLRLNADQCLEINSPANGNTWLMTNDLATIFPDGTFDIQGRKDDTIISGGVKIPLAVIEQAASAHFNGQLFAAGVPDDTWGQKLVLVIEQAPDTALANRILTGMKKQLPRYHVPKAIIFAPRFLLTASGKTDKRSTLETYLTTHGKK